MKSLIASLAVLCAATVQADFMLWTVYESDWESSDIDPDDVASMRVGYVTADGKQPTWEGHALTTYDLGGDSMNAAAVDYSSGAQYKVDLSGVSVNAYSFYIELLDNSGSVIGRTGDNESFTYTTYADLKSQGYVVSGDIGSVPQVNVWHGSMQAVPEPSSMALLALGAGLVGLRRKLRKGKKAKKEKRA